MSKRIEVLVLCNNRLLRESVARILAKKNDFNVIAALPVSADSRDYIEGANPSVVVVDSLQFILDCEARLPKADAEHRAFKCVLIAMQGDHANFLTAVRRGVLGYVLEDASAEDIAAAIRSVEQGLAVCPPAMARLLFDFVASQRAGLPNNRVRARLGLTRREQQLVPLIGRGLTNKEIASHLRLSEQTVKNHVHRILRKTGADDRLGVREIWESEALGV